MTATRLILLAALAASACGREEDAKKANPAAPAPQGADASKGTGGTGTSGAPAGAGSGAKSGGASGAGGSGAQTPAGDGGTDGSSSDSDQPPVTTAPSPGSKITDPGSKLTGKEYYTATVYKIFDASCSKCHADPRQNPDIRGPLSLFSYFSMKKLLDGDSAADSALMKKVRNLVAHSGGDRCESGPTGTPCKEISEWWRLENGADSGLAGELTAVSTAGEVTGYAVNANDATMSLEIDFLEGGAKVLTLMADQTGYDGGYDGGHAFKGELPPALRDGKEHDLTATVTLNGKALQVGKAVHFAAYTPKDAGKSYFAKTVQPAMGGCTGCHAVSYETMYASLINKPPYRGGTAADNELVNRASAAVAHPGGNLCGSKTGSPCNLFQAWWALEFK